MWSFGTIQASLGCTDPENYLLEVATFLTGIGQNRGKSDLKKVQWATITNAYINLHVTSSRVVWSFGTIQASIECTDPENYLLEVATFLAKIGKNDPKSASEQSQWPQNPVKTDHLGYFLHFLSSPISFNRFGQIFKKAKFQRGTSTWSLTWSVYHLRWNFAIFPLWPKNLRGFFSKFYLGSRYQIDTKKFPLG